MADLDRLVRCGDRRKQSKPIRLVPCLEHGTKLQQDGFHRYDYNYCSEQGRQDSDRVSEGKVSENEDNRTENNILPPESATGEINGRRAVRDNGEDVNVNGMSPNAGERSRDVNETCDGSLTNGDKIGERLYWTTPIQVQKFTNGVVTVDTELSDERNSPSGKIVRGNSNVESNETTYDRISDRETAAIGEDVRQHIWSYDISKKTLHVRNAGNSEMETDAQKLNRKYRSNGKAIALKRTTCNTDRATNKAEKWNFEFDDGYLFNKIEQHFDGCYRQANDGDAAMGTEEQTSKHCESNLPTNISHSEQKRVILQSSKRNDALSTPDRYHPSAPPEARPEEGDTTMSKQNSTAEFISEDYCEVCQKRFCNKYYTKKHRLDVHGRSQAARSAHGHGKPGSKHVGCKNLNSGKLTATLNSAYSMGSSEMVRKNSPPGSDVEYSSNFNAPFLDPLMTSGGVFNTRQSVDDSCHLSDGLFNRSNRFEFSNVTREFGAFNSLALFEDPLLCAIAEALRINNDHRNKWGSPSWASQEKDILSEVRPTTTTTCANNGTCVNVVTTAHGFSRTRFRDAKIKAVLETRNLQPDCCDLSSTSNCLSSKTKHKDKYKSAKSKSPSTAKEPCSNDDLFGRALAGFAAGSGSDSIVCELCGKVVCNKEFLETHKVKVHGWEGEIPLLGRRQYQGYGPFSSTLTKLVNGVVPSKFTVDDDNIFSQNPISRHSTATTTTTAEAAAMSSFSDLLRSVFREDHCANKTHSKNRFRRTDSPLLDCGLPSSSVRPGKDFSEAFERYCGEIIARRSNVSTKVTCRLCGKTLCNKYFLKTHLEKKHRIQADGDWSEQTGLVENKPGPENHESIISTGAFKIKQTMINSQQSCEIPRNIAECAEEDAFKFQSSDPVGIKYKEDEEEEKEDQNGATYGKERDSIKMSSSDGKSGASTSSKDLEFTRYHDSRYFDEALVSSSGCSKAVTDGAVKTANPLLKTRNPLNVSETQIQDGTKCEEEKEKQDVPEGRNCLRDATVELAGPSKFRNGNRRRCSLCKKRFKTASKLLTHRTKCHADVSHKSPEARTVYSSINDDDNTPLSTGKDTVRRIADQGSYRLSDTGEEEEVPEVEPARKLSMQRFVIKELAGSDRFCPAVVYLPSLRTISSPTSVTFTLTPVSR